MPPPSHSPSHAPVQNHRLVIYAYLKDRSQHVHVEARTRFLVVDRLDDKGADGTVGAGHQVAQNAEAGGKIWIVRRQIDRQGPTGSRGRHHTGMTPEYEVIALNSPR